MAWSDLGLAMPYRKGGAKTVLRIVYSSTQKVDRQEEKSLKAKKLPAWFLSHIFESHAVLFYKKINGSFVDFSLSLLVLTSIWPIPHFNKNKLKIK